MSSRLCHSLVVLLCLSFLCVYVSGIATYQLYATDTHCTTLSSSSTSLTTYTGTSASGSFTQSYCFSISGVTGVLSGIVSGITSTSATSSSFVLYSAVCPSSTGTPPVSSVVTSFNNLTSNTGSNGCLISGGGFGTMSAQWTINSNKANTLTASTTLVLLLAALVLAMMSM